MVCLYRCTFFARTGNLNDNIFEKLFGGRRWGLQVGKHSEIRRGSRVTVRGRRGVERAGQRANVGC